MKKTILTLVAALTLVSCGSFSTNKKAIATETKAAATITEAISLDSLLHKAETLVGQTVTIKGNVTHTCKHAGRRCFLMGDDQITTLRIEAKGEIGGFNRELIGSELAITGILRESKLTAEYLAAWEEKVNAKKDDQGNAEDCESEEQNIAQMREWMKKNNKEYYSLYYMDGESFEVIE